MRGWDAGDRLCSGLELDSGGAGLRADEGLRNVDRGLRRVRGKVRKSVWPEHGRHIRERWVLELII